MNESETKFETMNDSEHLELRSEVQSLRFMLSVSLLLSFVFSFFVLVYFYRQNSILNTQMAQQQQMLGQAAEGFNRMRDYAATHPDFAPIFQKYSQVINVRTNAAPAKR